MLEDIVGPLKEPIDTYSLKVIIANTYEIPLHTVHLRRNGAYLSHSDMVEPRENGLELVEKKNRCSCCQKKSATIVGDCKECGLKYCLVHRLPEDHKCPNMVSLKKNRFNQNRDTLIRQKTTSIKV